ncbi:hypothetical protein M3194_15770 [Paenibacillus glycanilyticus]|uniref:hypothetical protein n=1 Tax=Paenibacillus glycanilyticus TaxID=126569 RepID=UPI00203A5ED6|nr:hypothetical protein [Paenibacillus glycanilyticus]MCM3628802.1 hypothetical protein [Paenibacillus glycanilyticus]
MSQDELMNLLKATGYPVAYSHFNSDKSPPYIVLLYAFSTDLIAENQNYVDIGNYQIELYTAIKDLEAEKKVQDKLKEAKLPYSKTEVWIKEEKLYQILYQIQIIGG